MSNSIIKYEEYVKDFSKNRGPLENYSCDKYFAVLAGTEAILCLDDSQKERAFRTFKVIDGYYASGRQYPLQDNYSILAAAFLMKKYDSIMEKLDADNIAILADYFSLCEEKYIDDFIPIVSNNSLLTSIRSNCRGLFNQGIMCSKVISHALKDNVCKEDSEEELGDFSKREISYVESNPILNPMSEEEIRELTMYIHNQYFKTAKEVGK